MSNITEIIEQANYEKVNEKIYQILSIEIANQIALLEAAINVEPDPEKLKVLMFKLSCLPAPMYHERFIRPSETDFPYVNVIFAGSPLNDLITNSTQIGNVTYLIEGWASASTTPSLRGDTQAAKKLHYLLFVCRTILMNRAYLNLGFTAPLIGYRHATDIKIALPDDGADNTHNQIYGKLDFTVKMNETVPDIEGNIIEGMDTEVKLNETEKGLFWST